jgi:hypothetical protein
MVHPQSADGGEDIQIVRVAANILNKQSTTANKQWSSSLEVKGGGGGVKMPHHEKPAHYEIKMTKLLDIIHRLFLIKTHISETGACLQR